MAGEEETVVESEIPILAKTCLKMIINLESLFHSLTEV